MEPLDRTPLGVHGAHTTIFEGLNNRGDMIGAHTCATSALRPPHIRVGTDHRHRSHLRWPRQLAIVGQQHCTGNSRPILHLSNVSRTKAYL